MNDIILHQEDITQLTNILQRLVKKADIILSVLIHRDGHFLSAAGNDSMLNTTALSALVSANFASTIAIANLIGEREFKSQFHQGKDKCIFISLIDSNTFLASIFDRKTDIDTIKVYTKEYSSELLEYLETIYNKQASEYTLDDLDEEPPVEERLPEKRPAPPHISEVEPGKQRTLQRTPSPRPAPPPISEPDSRAYTPRHSFNADETDIYYLDLLHRQNSEEYDPLNDGSDSETSDEDTAVNTKYLKQRIREAQIYPKNKTRHR
jgi:predicted regulator of Ras-like GTPase activity (Roadblock/LC7/MglB family)